MSHILMIIKRLFSFQKYPRYIADFYIHFILPYILRSKGIILGNNIAWLGKPIITKVKGSSLSIGDRTVLCSRSTQTALGVSHPIVFALLLLMLLYLYGEKVRMSGTTICAATKIIIGNRCVIGADVIIADTDFHSLSPLERSSSKDKESAKSSQITIGDDVFIGGRTIILKGVNLGNNTIVGAGSVVTKSFSDNSIVAGNPAILLKKL